MIQTDRLNIYPASREQMEAMIASERDEELKKAYSEMLEGCLRHPEQWDWEAFQGRGYATEAVHAACRWAFGHGELKSLEAETEAGNAASQSVLAKCGFRATGTLGEEGPRFALERPLPLP